MSPPKPIVDTINPADVESLRDHIEMLIAHKKKFTVSWDKDKPMITVPTGRYRYEYTWNMYFPSDFSEQKVNEIGEALGCEVGSREYEAYELDADEEVTETEYYLVLPRLIGNAAHAFDAAKEGWVTKYRGGIKYP